MANQCGDCSYCCKLPGITAPFIKPVNQWCEHCAPGNGCQIYDTRPEQCRSYKCMWLVRDLPPELKLTRCGVIIEPLPQDDRVALRVEPHRFSTAWRQPAVLAFIKTMLRMDHKVMMTDGMRCNGFNPEPFGRWTLYEGEFVGMRGSGIDDERCYKFVKPLFSGLLT
jgi:hypothetical protein